MAVQQTSGGTAKDQQFVDTIGGFTGVGGSNQITISTSKPLKVELIHEKLSGNTFLQTKLSDLILTAGYAPVKLFQFYNISQIELWFHDIDYGRTWDLGNHIWSVYMAPWKTSPKIDAGNFGNINARYIPGCVWKNFVAPTTNGQMSKGFPHSSGNNQLLHLEVHDPVFEMETFSTDDSATKGRQMNNTFLPTYTRHGIDKTTWLAALVSYYQISGNIPMPNPTFHLYTLKVTFNFKGLRCLLTTALDLYLPDEEEEARANYINTTHEDVRSRKRTHPAEEPNTQHRLGNDTKKRRANTVANELHR